MADKLFICKECGKPTNNKYILQMPLGNDLVIHRCDDCQDKLDVKYEWKNEKWREDNIICPWCETVISDYEDMLQVVEDPYSDFEGTVKCPHCRKEFELEVETKCQYTSRKPSEQFNYEEWLESEREEYEEKE